MRVSRNRPCILVNCGPFIIAIVSNIKIVKVYTKYVVCCHPYAYMHLDGVYITCTIYIIYMSVKYIYMSVRVYVHVHHT